MSVEVSALEPKIRDILSAPGIDLQTISAKRVRKELLERDPNLSAEFVKEKKDEIDAIIARVYEEVSSAQNGDDGNAEDGAGGGGAKRKREDASEGDGEPAAQPKKSKNKQEMTDEELARQLSNEINGRSRTSRTAASSKTKANGAKRGGKKGPKSSATVASDEEGASGEEGAKPKRRGGGFTKEYGLSEPLGALLKVDKLSRPQIVKQLWNHIKANNMQNPENRKEIICDESFKAIFKCERIDMFKMNKELGQHLRELEPAAAES
ncbi:SWIB-domain-containing protein [Trametes coccinea BRFM310]|uniref:SWIB-domain-containing protein n=1 Tax=Trametes coccinea (strain BRFM310) TaxID=1353009 RepID=A0A1Y2IFE4_TRAC3|nr:SWIB-domain-containing protein [Trametes coccinea BRFM310]